METDTNFSVARDHVPSRINGSPAATQVPSFATPMAEWQRLHDGLSELPECRPGAVERARALIADPGFPSEEQLHAIAVQVAARLLSPQDSGASQP